MSRIPCIVPFCRRTAASEKFPDSTEIICYKHFRLIDKRIRKRHSWIQRWQDRHDPETYRNPVKVCNLAIKIWEQCKVQAIERAGGLN